MLWGSRSNPRPAAADSVASTRAEIPAKPRFWARNFSTATSFAAFSTVGAPPPASSARRASASAGNRAKSGRSNVRLATCARSSRGAGPSIRPGQARQWAIGIRMSGLPSWAMKRAVAKLDQPVDHRLGVNDNVDLVELELEQVVGLDHLQALVHQRGRIDRDLWTHRPIWMLERLLRRCRSDRLLGPRAERTARRSEDDAADILATAGTHRLEQSVVLGIDRQHGRAWCAARRMNSPPAQTRHSLLASATMAPRSAAASVGFNPAAPVIAPITQSAGRSAASTRASAPAAASMPVPASASLNSR